MNPMMLIAIVAVALTMLSGLAGIGALLFKMGRWQSKAEGRSHVLAERIDGIKAGLDLQFKGTQDQ